MRRAKPAPSAFRDGSSTNGQGGSVFRDESGREVTLFRITMMGVKGGKEIEEVEADFTVNGELFERVEDADTDTPLDGRD
jgi:hypothetical protein